jgi:hypothetical protein
VNSQIITRNTTIRAIAHQRDVVLDWDVRVDDLRHELDSSIRERDHAARHLEALVALAQKHGTDARGPEAALR